MVARFAVVVIADETGLVVKVAAKVAGTSVDVVVYGVLQAGSVGPYVPAGESMRDADTVDVECVDIVPEHLTKGVRRSHLVCYDTPAYFRVQDVTGGEVSRVAASAAVGRTRAEVGILVQSSGAVLRFAPIEISYPSPSFPAA